MTAKKLTLLEISILTSAARRRSRNVLPLPEGFSSANAACRSAIERLVTLGLIDEHPTKTVGLAWRTDPARGHLTIRITDAGKIAAKKPPGEKVVEGLATHSDDTADCAGTAPDRPKAALARGKLGLVYAAISAPAGASLDQLMTMTGWQAHTIRACISRFRKNHPVIMVTSDGARRYQAQPAAEGAAP